MRRPSITPARAGSKLWCTALVVCAAMLASVAARPVSAQQTRPAADATQIVVRDPVRTDQQKDWLDWLVAGSQVIAVFALPFIALQLLFDRRQARMQHTAELLQRWEARELAEVLSRVGAFLNAKDAADCVEKLIAWERVTHAESAELPRTPRDEVAPKASKNDVDHVRNFFEDVALRYNQREVLREPVISGVGYAALDGYQRALWLTHYEREDFGGDFPLYREWETMVRALRGEPRPDRRGVRRKWRASTTAEVVTFMHRLELAPPPRVICLPPGIATASQRDVEMAKRLSLALCDEALQRRLTYAVRLDEPEAEDGWTVLVTPPGIEASASELERGRHLARLLARKLDELDFAQIATIVRLAEREAAASAAAPAP